MKKRQKSPGLFVDLGRVSESDLKYIVCPSMFPFGGELEYRARRDKRMAEALDRQDHRWRAQENVKVEYEARRYAAMRLFFEDAVPGSFWVYDLRIFRTVRYVGQTMDPMKRMQDHLSRYPRLMMFIVSGPLETRAYETMSAFVFE